MTLNDFILKWQGKFLDFDGIYPNQCFDLFHQYLVECLGLTDGSILAAPAAHDIYKNFNSLKGHELFDRIENTPTNIPNEGDIIIWNSTQWGHVAIFIAGNVNTFNSFDQNWPAGSPCHVQSHNYNGVLGWLRYKGQPDTIAVLKTDFEILVTKATKLDNQVPSYEELKSRMAEIQRELDGTKEALKSEREFDQQLASKLACPDQQSSIIGAIETLLGLEEQLRTMTKNFNESQIALSERERMIEDMDKEIKSLSARLQNAQDMSVYYNQLESQFEKCQMDLDICHKQSKTLTNATVKELLGELCNRLFGKK
jgi:hypothetical protein